MTGCYPQQTGVTNNGRELSPEFDSTAPRVFGRAGYRTVQIGKLHFQNHEDHDLDPRARHDYGFDVLQLSEEPGCYEDAYRTWLRGEHPELVELFTVPRPMTVARRSERAKYSVLDAPWEASHSGWIATQFGNNFCSWGKREGRHFYHLGFYAPHPPLNPTVKMFAPYDGVTLPPHVRAKGDPRDPGEMADEVLGEYRRHFYAMVTGVDMAIGKILGTLKETNQLDNTLVVFSADHGDACGDHGRIAKGPTFLESIMRLPLILHWPDGLGVRERNVKGLVEMVDIMPTLTELCGIPAHRFFQGISFGRSLLDEAEIVGRPDVYAIHDDGDIMLRTERLKYLLYYRDQEQSELLYDLARDPHEMVDESGNKAYKERLMELRSRALLRTLDATSSLLPRPHMF